MTVSDIQSRLAYWATVYGVPPAIALSLAQQESGFNQAARGASGEVGILQIMPATAAGLHIDPYDPESNVEGGVRLLAQNYAQFGSWDYALAAFNCGGACASRGPSGWPTSTQSYVPSVLARARMYTPADVSPYPPTDEYSYQGPPLDVASSLDWTSTGLLLAISALAALLLFTD